LPRCELFKMRRITVLVHHYLPAIGGAERSLHRVMAYLSGIGHVCRVICFLDEFARPFVKKTVHLIDGVEIIQESFPVKNFVIDQYLKESDVIFTMLHLSPIVTELARKANKPVFHFFCDESVLSRVPVVVAMRSAKVVFSNSNTTRSKLKQRGVESTVLYPSFNSTARAERTKEHILFVNPRPHKGHEIVKELIKSFPRENFVIVGDAGIDLVTGEPVILSKEPNVKYLGNINDEAELDRIFSRSKLLLVPSQVPETFCMVAAEAIVRHTPIMASLIGALPETVGECGEIISEWQSSEAWKDRLSKFLAEDPKYDFEKHSNSLISLSSPEIVNEKLGELQ
jgi:glycosyltransferase involved in cell wall biosynthesis